MQEYDDYDHQHHQQIVKRVLDASIFKIAIIMVRMIL